jgi:release factor glutamine methyltransferase
MSTTHEPETVGFGPLRISFDGRVLRPRPWTTAQSAWAAEILCTAPAGPVLELCAGAGQIGLLAVAASSRPLVCVDLDPVACGYARRNAQEAGLAGRVEVREGPMDEVLGEGERFAVVVADPPWVRRTDVGRYPEDPVRAIDGGDDGMDVAWTCLETAGDHLLPGGTLLLQLGTVEQVDALRERLRDASLVVSEVRWCDRGVLVRLDLTEAGAAPAAPCGCRRTTGTTPSGDTGTAP